MSSLVWSPVFRAIERRLEEGDKLALLVVPFIKVEALKQLMWATSVSQNLKVVVRWLPQDLIAGVSDLEVYPFLKDQNIPLYFNTRIHLKLYTFESNLAFNTSGNLTMRGLGYADDGNIEVGNLVALDLEDWAQLYTILDESIQVDDEVHRNLSETLSRCFKPPPASPTVTWPKFKRKIFSIQRFPATESPKAFAELYSKKDLSGIDKEKFRRFAHDKALFKVPPDLNIDDIHEHLKASIKADGFVQAFVAELRNRRSMRFGAVTEWIHKNCEDVPLPYRWEVKQSVQNLYNWLDFAFPEISWDVPGAKSQVIYWNKI